MNLLDFRKQYPQYDDVNDEDLANSLYSKYYSDLPKEEFFGKFLPKAETKPTLAEETEAAATAGQEYWTGGKEQPKATGFDYPAPTMPEEQMVIAAPTIGLAEARRPSVTETLPAGAPVSERPLQMPARPFQPRADRVDALMLGAMADRAIEQPAPAPTRVGPTIEAAKQLEQRRILDLAVENVDAIAAARAGAQTLLDEYPDLSEPKEQSPLTYSALSAGARFISNMGDALYKAAETGEAGILEPGIQTAIQPQVLTQFQRLASSLFPRDEEGKIKRLEISEQFEKKAKELQPNIQNVSFDDAWDGDRAAAWTLAKMAGSADSILLTAATIVAPKLAPVTLPIIATSSAGGAYAEARGKGVAQDVAALSSDIAGASEAAFEFLDVVMFRGAGKAMFELTRKMSPAQKDAFAASLTGKALQGMAITSAAAAGSGTSEALTSIVQDLSKKYVAGLEPGDMEKNAKEAFIVGAAMGPLFTAAGAVPAAVGRIEERAVERSAEEARTEALERWRTQGLTQGLQAPVVPAAPITPAPAAPVAKPLEQVQQEILDSPDLASAISNANQSLDEIPVTREVIPAEPAAVTPEALARIQAVVEGVPAEAAQAPVELPIAPTPAPPPPAVEAAPAAPARAVEAPAAAPAPVPAEAPAVAAPTEAAAPAQEVILQNRNRATPASIAQMASIAAKPDYGRLGFSRDFANGAPVVFGGDVPETQIGREDVAIAQDGRRIPVRYAVVDAAQVLASNKADGTVNAQYGDLNVRATRAIAGNGRIAGLQAAYEGKKAGPYRKELADDTLHGIDKAVIRGMKRPVLVRIMPEEAVTPDIGDVSNISAGLALSPVEQAKNDSNRIDLGGLEFAPDGEATNKTLVQFVRAMPQAEQGALIDTNGAPTAAAVDRLNAAIFSKAYNNDELVRLYAQAKDPDAKMVLSALAQAAPRMARLEGSGDFDIRSAVTQAAEAVVNARRTGLTLDEVARQVDLTVSDPSVQEILKLFARNPRRVKPIVQALQTAADLAYAEANKPSEDMFGTVQKRTRQEILKDLEQYETSQATLDVRVEAQESVRNGVKEAEDAPNKESIYEAADTDSPANAYARKVMPRGGVKLIAGGFNKSLQARGSISLVGQVVRSPADLAELAQIYRNPGYETFRAFFVDGSGRIIHQTGFSSRLPGQTGVIPGNLTTTNVAINEWYKDMVKKTKAAGFYVLHNHPSGNPQPSRQDIEITKDITEGNPAFLGHVVIDSNKYVEILKSGRYYERPLRATGPDKVRENVIKSGVVGTTIGNSQEVARLGLMMQRDKNMSVVIAQGRRVEAIGEIPNEVLMHPTRGFAAIRNFARFNGGAKIFIYTTNEIQASRQLFSMWEGGFITDAVSENGRSIVASIGRLPPRAGTFGRTTVREVRQPEGEERAIQEPSAAEIPVLPRTEGRQAVGERDTEGQEIAGKGRAGEAGAEVAQPTTPYLPTPWFSELGRQVDKGPESMPAAQWKGWIANRPGIKKDEIYWSGINDWLDLQQGKVTKAQVSEYLKNNGVRIEEIQSPVGGSIGTQDFRTWQLPGGENYREVLLTLPVKQEPTGDLEYVSNETGQVLFSMKGGEDAETIATRERVNNATARPKMRGRRGYLSTHWRQPNVLAHIRVNDRVDADGKKVLFVEEIQSDWGQKGKGIGFTNKNEIERLAQVLNERQNDFYDSLDLAAKTAPEFGRFKTYESFSSAVKDEELKKALLDPIIDKIPSGLFNEITQKMELVESAKSEFNKEIGKNIAPAPFVSARQFIVYKDGKELVTKNKEGKDVLHRYDSQEAADAAVKKFGGEVRDMGLQANTEGWLNLALKRIITMAYQGEYDAVAFINGEQSADRYDLSKQIKSIEYEKRGDNSYLVTAFGNDGSTQLSEEYTEAQLEGVVGKEIAKKIVSGEGEKVSGIGAGRQARELSGVDLKVGGEGMKAFYDQIVPAALKKVLSKLGGGQMKSIEIKRRAAISEFSQRQQEDFMEENGYPIDVEVRSYQQPGFYVTDNLKDNVSEGIALFEPQAPYGGNQASFDAPEPSRLDRIIRLIQDKNIDLKRVIDRVKAIGREVTDAFDPYLQEGLAVSRMAAADQDFQNNELNPLLEEIGKQDLTLAETEEYLHARHAKSRNKVMAERNPTKEQIDAKIAEIDAAIKNAPPGSPQRDRLESEKRAWQQVSPWRGTEEERLSLSGMSDDAAAEYLKALSPEKKAKLDAIAERVDAIIAKTRNMLIQGGVDSTDSFNDQWEYYVPLHREGKEESGSGYGQGFSVKGKTTRTATGSTRKVVDILANVAAAREQAITRVEKNRVANALVGFAMLNPDPKLWRVDIAPKRAVLDKATGKVVMRHDPNYKNDDNVIVARMPDGKGGIVEHAVVFNRDNETAVNIVAAMKGLDSAELGRALTINAKATRFLASMNTQYNPIFGVVNLVRDLQSSAINIQGTPIAGKQKELISEATKALGAIFLELRAQRRGEKRDTEYSKLFEEFRKEGGQTGFRDAWVLNGDRTKQMDTLVKRAAATGLKRTSYQAARALGSVTKDLLSDYNTTLENAIRVAAYKIAKEQGLSKPRAAMVAKDVTVNFNRKGTLSNQIGAGYAFFNAAVQGTERLGRVLDIRFSPNGVPSMGPRGQKIVLGGVLIGVAQAMALAAAGIDEDEIPDFIKEKNLIIPIALLDKVKGINEESRSRGYITIPMPLGLHVLPNLGRLGTELTLSGFKDPGKKALKMFGVTVDAFNPLGTSAGLQTLAPTTLDPVVALLENKDWTGKPISRENFDQLGSVPGFERARDNPSYIGMAIAKGLNYASGGTEFSSGIISPTPEAIEYLIGQATGGPGRELTKAQKSLSALSTGEELPPSNIPLVSRFYGEIRTQTSQGQQFYDNVKKLLKHERELKGREAQDLDTDDYLTKFPEAEYWPEARRAMREVQEIRRDKRQAIKENAPKDEIRDYDLQITERMTDFNNRMKEIRQ